MLTRRTLLGTAATAAFTTPALAQKTDQKLDDTTAPGFTRGVVIRWGDRVEPDSPPFAPDTPSAEAAARQFGWDAILLGTQKIPPGEDGVARMLMAVAHPTADGRMMFPGGVDRPGIAALAQGASILNLENHGGQWLVTDGGYQTRRLTARTLCRITGPSATQTDEAAQGVLGIAAGGMTPWGTVLMAEGDPSPWFARLRNTDPTLPQSRNARAYGWVVELDPTDPQAMPAKRTALGRFPRAGLAATQTRDGRAVVFMSDDRPAGHLFRFVSDAPVSAENRDALDSGTLSVAMLDGYTLRWLTLPQGGLGPLDAARNKGAARFASPAGIAFDGDGNLLLACRGTSGLTSPNPSDYSPGTLDGEVLILRPSGRDPAGDSFSTEIGLLGGDTGLGGAMISRPATLAVGVDGRIWVGTEASTLAVGAPGFGPLDEVYRPPVGAVIGGVAFSPDDRVAFAAVRHPGATPGATFDRPATRWPSLQRAMPPQTVIVALGRDR